ncbi:MAG: hypothetical protein JXR95_14665 [Deltaproteobacteria bacterium]|nr:hypothetical protein [Deltaproteobacteria bacterium]
MNRLKFLPVAFTILFLQGCPDGGSSSSDFNYGVVSDFAVPCAASSQCESGRCIDMNGGTGCTRYCYDADDCADGFYCAPEETDPPMGLCREINEDAVCHSCSNDSQCESIGGVCRTVGTGNYCLMDCSMDDCPDGFSCVPQTDGEQLCIPDTNDCTCNIFREGVQRSCSNSNDYGSCSGVIECHGELGWSNCVGQIPGPETCDGEDNNCDGEIDEGLLGTADHCSMCYDVCQGSGLAGTEAVCIDGSCGVACYSNYYDANSNSQDGCECADDTQGAVSGEAAISLGAYSDCDFTQQFTTAKIPADYENTAHADYFKFNYNNVWNCQENLQVELRVYSPSPSHTLCVSGANKTDESTWNCQNITAGNSLTIRPYDSDGVYYVRVSLTNEGEPNCMAYQLTIKDD